MLFYKAKHLQSDKVVKAIASPDSAKVHAYDKDGKEEILHPLDFSRQYEKMNPQPDDFPCEPGEPEELAEKPKTKKTKEVSFEGKENA